MRSPRLARRGDVEGWVDRQRFRRPAPRCSPRRSAVLPLFGTAAANVQRVRDPQTFFARARPSRGCPSRRAAQRARRCHRLARQGCRRLRRLAGAPVRRPACSCRRGTISSARCEARRCRRPSSPTAAMPSCSASTNSSCGASARGRSCSVASSGRCRSMRCWCSVSNKPCAALTVEFELCGLGSLDFMLDGDAVGVLEVNPRPPASVALYRDQAADRGAPARLPHG